MSLAGVRAGQQLRDIKGWAVTHVRETYSQQSHRGVLLPCGDWVPRAVRGL